MPSSQIFAFLVAAVDLALGGLISNGFIVTVIIHEWTKNKSLTASEQLLLSLGISNFLATVLLTPFYIDDFIMTNFTFNLVLRKIFPIAVFLVISRYWLTAWLCVFYCIKIVNSTRSFFLWCKLRISWLTPRVLVGSLIVSFLVSFFAFLNKSPEHQSNTTAIATTGTQGKTMRETVHFFKFSFVAIASGGPFLIVFVCSILVVVSLCTHARQMTSEESTLKNPQTEVHIKAARTVLFLLFLYASFLVSQFLSMTVDLRRFERLAISAVMMVYSPAQAYILLLGNPKLKQAAAQKLPR
ncbi:taste receptor type 2 member 40-like [Pogona vitticeps]